MEPSPWEEESQEHSPEPWTQYGRYIRDANGAIVVRGRSPADARRIVAAVNATQGMPTEALQSWTVQVVSDPKADVEVVLEREAQKEESEAPPEPAREPEPLPATEASAQPAAAPGRYVFDRRVYERRREERRKAGQGAPEEVW